MPGLGSSFIFTMRVEIVQPVFSNSEERKEQTPEYSIPSTVEGSHHNMLQEEDLLPLESPIIAFSGVSFDISVSHSIPMEVLRGTPLPQFE